MKSYTDLKQSNILKGILPIESADNYYSWHDERYYIVNKDCPYPYSLKEKTPCWSLAALLDYISANFRTDIKYLDNYWELDCRVRVTYSKELVDACYEMIVKLHEQKVL